MATRFTYEGSTMRVEWLRPLALRLVSIVFLGPSLYLAHFLVIGLKQDLSGQGSLREDWPGFLALLGIALVVGAPGYVLATFRYFIDIEQATGEIVITRKFGPLPRLRFRRKLSEFTGISIVRDLANDEPVSSSWFRVNLYGTKVKGTRPVEVASFRNRQEANEFAQQLGTQIGLKPEDFADTEPDDPDLEDAAPKSGAKT